ncbi:MAG: hypothetical protein Q9157_008556 [Trypethelium eluteriae]
MGTRLHWSMVTRKDVSELRDVIMSKSMPILMLLSILQITRIKTIAVENQGLRNELSQSLPSIAQAIQATPKAIADLNDFTKIAVRDQHQLLKRSQNVLDTVTQNARLILDIHTQMSVITRLVGTISPHITPPIIQLDDACGQTWALPLQACSDWASFTNVLRAVVYPHGKPGHISIASERFVISHADSGRIIQPDAWKHLVRDRLHIENAMLVSEQPANRNQCPYPNCFGKLISESGPGLASACAKCERRVIIEWKDVTLLSPFREDPLTSKHQENAHIPRRTKRMAQRGWPIKPLPGERANNFRRIHLFEHRDPITSPEEAQEILKGDSSDARANQFLGWYSLTSNTDGPTAVSFLERAIESDGTGGDGQSWYLIARAYEMYAHKQQDRDARVEVFNMAFRAYMQSLKYSPLCPHHSLSEKCCCHRGAPVDSQWAGVGWWGHGQDRVIDGIIMGLA